MKKKPNDEYEELMKAIAKQYEDPDDEPNYVLPTDTDDEAVNAFNAWLNGLDEKSNRDSDDA